MNIGTCCFFSQLAVGDRFALTQRCMLLVDPFLESSFGYVCVSVCNDSNGAPARVGVDSLIPSWWLGGFRICGFQKQSWCVVLKTLLRFQSLLVMCSFTFQVIRSCKCRETTTYLWNLLVILGYIPIRWWRHTYKYHDISFVDYIPIFDVWVLVLFQITKNWAVQATLLKSAKISVTAGGIGVSPSGTFGQSTFQRQIPCGTISSPFPNYPTLR